MARKTRAESARCAPNVQQSSQDSAAKLAKLFCSMDFCDDPSSVPRQAFLGKYIELISMSLLIDAVGAGDVTNFPTQPTPVDPKILVFQPLMRALVMKLSASLADPKLTDALTDTEAALVLPPIFAAFDSDADGYLSRANVATLLESATAALVAIPPAYFMQCSVAQHQRTVHAAKRTATDSIGEVVAKTHEAIEVFVSQITTLRGVLQARIDALFALLDRDRDGRVSAAEFETWFAPRESTLRLASGVAAIASADQEPECALTALFDLRVWGIVTDTTALTEELEYTKQGVESVLNCMRSGELDIVDDQESRASLLQGYEEQYFSLMHVRATHRADFRHFCTRLRHEPTLLASVIRQHELSPDTTASEIDAVVAKFHDSAILVVVIDECVQMTVQVLEALGGAAPTHTLTSALLAAASAGASASASAGMPAAAPALRRAVSAERAIAAAAAITALMCESEGEGEGEGEGVAPASAVAAASDSVAALALAGEGESDGESGHNGAGSHRVDADAAAALHEAFIRLVVADATVRAVEGDEGFEMRSEEMKSILARLANYFGAYMRYFVWKLFCHPRASFILSLALTLPPTSYS
jgi:Ca2+-binding EF-hand superfamily protein